MSPTLEKSTCIAMGVKSKSVMHKTVCTATKTIKGASTVFRMAGQLGVPVQLHTGSIWGGFNMANISPEHLAEVICAFPNTKFDLLHCGDPFFGVTALMGSNFPNVYVNMSAMPKNSLCNFRHWLDVYLDRVPSRKITLGWDEFTPEMVLAPIPGMWLPRFWQTK